MEDNNKKVKVSHENKPVEQQHPMLLSYAKLAAAHRQKVIQNLKSLNCNTGFAYLRGGSIINRLWTDVEEPFRQESNFYYMTGVQDPDHHLILDLEKKETLMFIPKFSPDHALWCGEPAGIELSKSKFGIEHVYFVDQLVEILMAKNKANKRDGSNDSCLVHVIDGTNVSALKNSSSMKTLESLVVEEKFLRKAITEARIYKSPREIELMRKAAKISGDAHIELMKAAKARKGGEQQLHALFLYSCFSKGAPFQSYVPIVASGKAAAVLHYVENNKPLSEDSRNLLLVDAGCAYQYYASDITRTYPIGGKFEGDWKTVYEIVLDAQKAVLKALKPGVKWEDMHRLANRVIGEGLLKAGVIKGNIEDLIKNHIPALFFPHGLGHLLGMDVHDVGGYPEGVERIQEPGIRYLRMRRTLEPGMVVTVEPGLYFVDAILDPAINDPKVTKFLNLEVLKRFRKNVGGVRIEDDVVITSDGIDNLTGWVPKEVKDIEALMM